MKLILTREVAGLGLAGDIVEVADGYGRNFLVPRGAAISWIKGAEKQIAQIKRARDAREIRDLGHAREIKADLEKLSVSLGARAGKDGRLFGSITAADIAAAVKDAGGPVLDRKRIQIDGHIKTTGSHTITVDLHPDVVASVPVRGRGGLRPAPTHPLVAGPATDAVAGPVAVPCPVALRLILCSDARVHGQRCTRSRTRAPILWCVTRRDARCRTRSAAAKIAENGHPTNFCPQP